MQAVVLAAGEGTRLRPLTLKTPKALVDIQGRPLLERILDALPDPVTEILIVVGYKRDQIRRRIGKTWNGKSVRYVVQTKLVGTGDAIHRAKKYLHDRFLVVNGDDLYTKADLERLTAHPLGILLNKTRASIPFSALLDASGRLTGIEAKAPASEEKLQPCGAYLLDERFFHYPLVSIPVRSHEEFSLPHTLIEMAKDVPIHAEFATGWRPVGTPEELAEAQRA
jgi:bifunctional UDP-N-acetylglucosamine pyrophosphorylase/glucosamine-1-phosphate N-acetyltransferase